jgi:dCTP deaminase
MALSDAQILDEKDTGNVVIKPFERKNLGTASYDVTLGRYFFAEQTPQHFRHVYNPYDKKHVERIWGTEALEAEPAERVFRHYNFDFEGISESDEVILLDPGETILAHTQEFIGGRDHITTMMKARSSLGRNFIEICKCAGWGDVGFVNRWTMEITNNSQHYSIPLVVGRRTAQIIFFETGQIVDSDYTESGKYQTETNLENLRDQWRPDQMLPKMYEDREVTNN